MIITGWSVNLTTLFLSMLRPPKWLTSTSYTYFPQKLTTALLESAKGERESMWLDRVSYPGPMALEPDMLLTVLCSFEQLGHELLHQLSYHVLEHCHDFPLIFNGRQLM